MATLSEIVRSARERKGMSQKALAAAAGVSEDFIAAIEHRLATEPGTDIRKVTDALGIDRNYVSVVLAEAAMDRFKQELRDAAANLKKPP